MLLCITLKRMLCTLFHVWINNFIFIFVLQDYALKHTDSQSLLDSFNTKIFYFTRTRGLFRYCYPKERPPASIGKF